MSDRSFDEDDIFPEYLFESLPPLPISGPISMSLFELDQSGEETLMLTELSPIPSTLSQISNTNSEVGNISDCESPDTSLINFPDTTSDWHNRVDYWLNLGLQSQPDLNNQCIITDSIRDNYHSIPTSILIDKREELDTSLVEIDKLLTLEADKEIDDYLHSLDNSTIHEPLTDKEREIIQSLIEIDETIPTTSRDNRTVVINETLQNQNIKRKHENDIETSHSNKRFNYEETSNWLLINEETPLNIRQKIQFHVSDTSIDKRAKLYEKYVELDKGQSASKVTAIAYWDLSILVGYENGIIYLHCMTSLMRR